MRTESAVRLEDVSKSFHIYERPRDRLKQFVLPSLRRSLGLPRRDYHREFWALQHVSLDIPRGHTVGIIGRNGSGKSTLLQIVAGTLMPTGGRVETAGRVGALLELGSGFNPDFTGRENVYLNGAVLGLSSAEVDRRFRDITAFADIGDFIDQPVKTYSSGMVVRLAFALQAQLEPDILIVDEALAVGDARFQARCFDRLRQLKERGTSILLVTHSGEQIVTHCSEAILLDEGRIVQSGAPRQIVNRYLDLLFGRERMAEQQRPSTRGRGTGVSIEAPANVDTSEDVFHGRPAYNPGEYRWGDGAATILDFDLQADGQPCTGNLLSGQEVNLQVAITFRAQVFRPIFGVTVKTKEGVTVYGTNTELAACDAFSDYGSPGDAVVIATRFSCDLGPGDYFLSLGVASRQGEIDIPHDRRYDAIHLVVSSTDPFFGVVNLAADLQVVRLTQ